MSAFLFVPQNFMIQGGDPTGTGRGGQSIWGRPFLDELNQKLTHSGARSFTMKRILAPSIHSFCAMCRAFDADCWDLSVTDLSVGERADPSNLCR